MKWTAFISGAMAATIELLVVEVWTNLRPNLAGVSAWTLDGCLMKYDRFKQQLIGEQEEVQRQREVLPGAAADVLVCWLQHIGLYPRC